MYRPSNDRSKRTHGRRLRIEPLEPRRVLDSTVVFNEIMFNPATAFHQPGDQDLEWLELHNQLAVDMDLSEWRLDGAIEFEFPEGTLIPGEGYLVVAALPQRLLAETGFSEALGPYVGYLANGGERIDLLNNSDRLMDTIEYGDRGAWPEAADGSGATLAKIDPDSASGPAENWTFSREVGGTPAARNIPDAFVPPEVSVAVSSGAQWSYEASGTDLGSSWREPAFDDDGWESAQAAFFADPDANQGGEETVSASATADNHFALYVGNADGGDLRLIGRNTQGWDSPRSFSFSIDAGMVPETAHLYLAAWEAPGDSTSPQMLIAQFDFSDGSQRVTNATDWQYVLGPDSANPGGSTASPPPAIAGLQTLITDANAGADWAAPAAQQAKTAGPWGGAVGSSFSGPAQFIWPDTFGNNSITNVRNTYVLFRSTETVVPSPGKTQLPPGQSTYYFRTEFPFSEAPARTELLLDTLLDDGAIFYLNGTEIYRHNMPSGAVTHATPASVEVDEAGYTYGITLGADGLVRGFNVLAVEVHQAVADDTDMLFGAALTTRVHPPDPDDLQVELAFNEIAAATDEPFWLELTNPGEAPISLEGYVVATSAGSQYVLPAQSLDAGQFMSLTESQLGFRVAVGERLFLYSPDQSLVLDGVRAETSLQGRAPDGPLPGATRRWWFPSMETPAAANVFAFHDEIVINEIMYHHRPLTVPPDALPGELPEESDEEWIELYNRGQTTIDLAGWKLDDAISYEFLPGTSIAPGEYLVVAKDAAALREKYTTIEIVGDFSRRLANDSDRIVLLDTAGNPADAVQYFDDGRWPQYADGGGASLELRNPEADNSVAEAWAASDEASQSTWQTYTYRGIAQASRVGPDGQWREFVMGLLQAGEVLVDDLSVVENPDGNRIELIQNGRFSADTADRWRIVGNHRHSEVIVDPDNPSNRVLRLVATGPSGHKHDHAETTLASNRSIVNGREYEISFRAKWIGGSNQLNTRLYFNRLAQTTLIEKPEHGDSGSDGGTPGQENSVYRPNVGPTYQQLQHSPVVPSPFEPVTVSVGAEDPDGIASMVLWYSVTESGTVDSGPFNSLPMVHQAGGPYRATLPGQTASTIVQFYIEGQDTLGATSTYPAAGRNSGAMVKFDDGLAATNGLHNFRLILTPQNADWLHTDVNLMSNDYLPATVIYKESEIYYDVGVRLKGSERGRVTVPRLGFGVRFNADQLFQGIHRTALIDRSHSTGFGQREMLINQTMNRAGGLPSEYNDLIQVLAPQLAHTGSAELQLARFTDVFLDEQFRNGGDGQLFEYELIYYPTTTNTGSPEGLKRPQPDSVVGTSIRSLGDDKEAYRWTFEIKNNRTADDYGAWIEFAKVFGQSGSAFHEQIGDYIDVDQWLRAFALATLSGAGDNYAQGAQHNAQFYIRPDDGRVIYFPHDLDAFYNSSASVTGNSDLRKLITMTANARLYYGHLNDIIATSYNGSYMSHWSQHYGSLLPGQDFPGYQSFIVSRSNFVSNAVRGYASQVPFTLTTGDGNDFSVDDVLVTIEGTAWVDVKEIRLAGSERPLDVEWIGKTRWRVNVPLQPEANLLTFQAIGFGGEVIGSRSMTVTSTVPSRPLYESLRITEVHYHPPALTPDEQAAGVISNEQFEFIELQNVGAQPVDLAGVQFIDAIDFKFPSSGEVRPILITEIGNGREDWIEIQNTSTEAFATAGWIVVLNEARNDDVHGVHSQRWSLPDSMAGDEVLYSTDSTSNSTHYFGDNIYWRTDGPGWAMIVDQAGQVADFVTWGYTEAEIASLTVDVNGFDVKPADAWTGPLLPKNDDDSKILRRTGSADHDDASDFGFAFTPSGPQGPLESQGIENAGLLVPFAASGYLLEPGEFVVVAGDAVGFEARYGDQLAAGTIELAGYYDLRLNNGGERITMIDRFGLAIADFRYDDSGAWPGRADGRGSSLELIDPAAVPQTDPERSVYLQEPRNWRSGSEYHGTPGRAGEGPRGDVLINEVFTNSLSPLVDWIELVNTTDAAIDLGGWYLSDSNGDFRKYRIPADTTIAAGEYLAFDESHFNPSSPPTGQTAFALNGAHGDDVWLTEADDQGDLVRFVDHVEFGAAAQRESFGRWADAQGRLYPMRQPSLGFANIGPRVGPVVISELMYNPTVPSAEADPDDFEYIEIHNPTLAAVDLTNWRIRKGIDFEFPTGSVLSAGETLLVVSFAVTDAAKLAALRDHYQFDPSVRIMGPYSDLLNDDGEKVQLQRPDSPPADELDYIPHLIEDEVVYGDVDPWPAEPDGTGTSLTRLSLSAWGNDAVSWSSETPTPGMVTITDDAYEPNNSLATAYQLAGDWSGTPLSTIAGPGIQADTDWYRIDVAEQQRHLTVDVTFSHALGNIDVQLVDSSGSVHAASQTRTDNERIDVVLAHSGTWLLRVIGDNSGGPYDLIMFADHLHPGDANLSGATDLSDFNIWNAHKFMTGTEWTTGDFNGDGSTDLSDFNIWNAYKFTTAAMPDPTPPTAAAGELADSTATIDELAWLRESQRSRRSKQSSSASTLAAQAVDRLLATYWE